MKYQGMSAVEACQVVNRNRRGREFDEGDRLVVFQEFLNA